MKEMVSKIRILRIPKTISCNEWTCRLRGRDIEVKRSGSYLGIYHQVSPPYCEKCSSQGKSTEGCGWHHDFDPALLRVYALGTYFEKGETNPRVKDILSAHILYLKSDLEFARPIGAAMTLAARMRYPELSKYDLLIPVPSYDRAKGFDHAEELAEMISELLGKPWKQLLSKLREERMVGKGTSDERREACKELYALAGSVSESSGKSVVLIDDICTSGNTLSSCCRVLSNQGKADRVCAFVAARRFDTGYPVP